MKKVLFIISFLVAFVTTSIAQVQIVSGKTAQFTPPKGITQNKTYLFPTFDLQTKLYADTMTATVNQLETWVKIDTLKGNGLLILAPQSHVLPGAKLWVQCGKDGTARTLTIKQGSYILDTLGVGNNNVKRFFVYNGTKYEKVGQ